MSRERNFSVQRIVACPAQCIMLPNRTQ